MRNYKIRCEIVKEKTHLRGRDPSGWRDWEIFTEVAAWVALSSLTPSSCESHRIRVGDKSLSSWNFVSWRLIGQSTIVYCVPTV